MNKANKKTGFFLLICGVGLLAVNLRWINISWGVIWTFCPMLYGLSMYYSYFKSHNRDLLTLATFLTASGIFFFVNAIDIGLKWPVEIPWWPVLPFFWALGMVVTYIADRKDINQLFYSVGIMCVSVLLVFSDDIYKRGYLKFWPAILIIISIFIFAKSRKVSQD